MGFRTTSGSPQQVPVGRELGVQMGMRPEGFFTPDDKLVSLKKTWGNLGSNPGLSGFWVLLIFFSISIQRRLLMEAE